MSISKRGAETPKRKFSFKSFTKLLSQVKPAYWQLAVGLVLGLIATGAQLIVPKMAGGLINSFKQGISATLIAAVIGLFIFSTLISALSGTLLGFFGENVVAKLRERIWTKLLHLKVSYFDNTKSGEMTSRLVNDTTQVKDLIASAFPSFVSALLTLVGALIIMLTMDWHMTLLMFLAVPLVLFVMLPVINKSRKIGMARQDALAAFSGRAGETLSDMRLVKSSNAEESETSGGASDISDLYHIGLKESLYSSIAGPLMSAVMLGLFVGVLAYGAHRVAVGTMSMGTMFAFLMYLFQLMGPASTLGTFFSTLAKTNGSTARIQDLLDEPEEDFKAGNALDIAADTLQMADVSFAYDGTHEILHHVNFTAKPNTMIAFVGPSGGGKSTIFSLLERYYTPNSGQILIGDQNINDLQLKDWRQQIALVSQDSTMVAGTIRDNLTYGMNTAVPDSRLWAVLDYAYAKDFVAAMPDKLDTLVGERGVKLSGGQRQRIAIARAFLRDAKILMLDEATAALDPESEKMIKLALAQLMKGRTTLAVAHRLSTIVDADEIYFIENGTVSGHGKHATLVQNHALYRDYVHTQFDM